MSTRNELREEYFDEDYDTDPDCQESLSEQERKVPMYKATFHKGQSKIIKLGSVFREIKRYGLTVCDEKFTWPFDFELSDPLDSRHLHQVEKGTPGYGFNIGRLAILILDKERYRLTVKTFRGWETEFSEVIQGTENLSKFLSW